MKTTYNSKIIWITGASSGIGEELAYEFSRKGAQIILSSRNEQELMRVRQNCVGKAEDIFVLPLDLSDREDIEGKAELALAKWKRIDCLIHNAGIAARDCIMDTDMSVYRTVMETNFFGPVALTKAVLHRMINSGGGQLVVISSLSGKYGVPKLSAYSASKHALHGFFNSLRAEYSKQGIWVSIIIPGFINTPIIRKGLDGRGNNPGKNMSVNENGMLPGKCALKIINAIEKNKQETLIGGAEIYSIYLNRFFPKLFSWIISNHPVRKLQSIFKRKPR
jgi:short-subunit dehydrogenase